MPHVCEWFVDHGPPYCPKISKHHVCQRPASYLTQLHLNDLNDSQSWDLIWLDAIFTISPRWGIIRKDKHIQPEIWRSKIFRDIPGPLTMALIHVQSVQAWICCVIEIYPDVDEWCFCKDVGDEESFVCFSLWSFLFCCRTKMNFFPIGHWVFDFEMQNQVILGHLWPQDGPILHLITGHPICTAPETLDSQPSLPGCKNWCLLMYWPGVAKGHVYSRGQERYEGESLWHFFSSPAALSEDTEELWSERILFQICGGTRSSLLDIGEGCRFFFVSCTWSLSYYPPNKGNRSSSEHHDFWKLFLFW